MSTTAAAATTAEEPAQKTLRDIEEAHTAACEAGASRYIDPATGYKVFTKVSHEKRGFCCGNACRYIWISPALVNVMFFVV